MKEKFKALDLGCGHHKGRIFSNYPNYVPKRYKLITLDIDKSVNPDFVHDMNDFPYPFKDNEFDVVGLGNVLEHIEKTDPSIILSEIRRITKPNGIIKIELPHVSCMLTYAVPSHKKFYSLGFFRKMTGGETGLELLNTKLIYGRIYPPNKSTILHRIAYPILNFLANLNTNLCDRVWCYWVGGFGLMYGELKVIKKCETS